jgi:hypothetical protein
MQTFLPLKETKSNNKSSLKTSPMLINLKSKKIKKKVENKIVVEDNRQTKGITQVGPETGAKSKNLMTLVKLLMPQTLRSLD